MFDKTFFILIALSLLFATSQAAADEPATKTSTPSSAEAPATKTATKPAEESKKKAPDRAAVQGGDVIDHSPFETLLGKYVDARGQVAYAGWARATADREALKKYVDAVGRARVEGKSEASRLAFYINAYNAIVLNSVLEKWPVESVMKVDGFFTEEKHRVANREMTLDDLEHNKVIRVEFNEPRIHFVLVCAAKSCPRLLRNAMTEKNLEGHLNTAAREFIPAATTRQGNKVITSQLFNWFKVDFEKDAGSVAAYLAKYVDTPTAAVL
ncbi:MAG: DUF547 domain-containing protein, partial [Bradymonadaceae bacterium]